jgi:hypothetical protein
MLERTSWVLESLSLQHLFIIAYTEIYVFRRIPSQGHSLEQSYHPTQHLNRKNIKQNKKYKYKNNTQLTYLTSMNCKYEFEKHKQFSLVKNVNKFSIIKA